MRIKRHMTTVVFVICTAASLASVGLALWINGWAWLLLLGAIALNLWALITSERRGFVRSNQLRRAFEPSRHFNAAQSFTIIVLIMLQVGAGAYVLLVR